MNTRDLIAITRRMHALADTLELNAAAICDNAHNFRPGIRAASYDSTPISTSGHRDLSDTITAHPEPDLTLHNGYTLNEWCRRLDTDLAGVYQLAHQLTPRHARDVDDRPTATCECCGGTVACVGDHRLRAGLCPSDHKAWCRAGKPERAGWMLERRRYLDQKAG